MKKHTNPLQTNWRNFTTTSKKVKKASPKLDSAAPKLNVKLKPSENKANSNGNLNVLSKANSLGSNTLPGLSKFHNNPKDIVKRFKNNSNLANNDIYLRSNSDEVNKMIETLNDEDQEKYFSFNSAKNYSRINRFPSKPGKYNLEGVKNRRLGAVFSRVISKIAEDSYGAVTEGDDFWDTDRLAMRSINKESIYKCRNSREKQNIIVILDSSPSCSELSDLYSKIAIECINYGDVELYDAPNARLVHMYSHKQQKFAKFLTIEDIKKNVHSWSLFKNRTIIFFGDFDGAHVVFKNTIHNKVYYFTNELADSCLRKMELYKDKGQIAHNFRNLKMIPRIYDLKNFMEACKKLK